MKKDEKREKMIKVVSYYYTSSGNIKLPSKVVFKKGAVYMPTNKKHNISASDVKPVYFSKQQMTHEEAVEKCLKLNGIQVWDDEQVKEYKKILKVD